MTDIKLLPLPEHIVPRGRPVDYPEVTQAIRAYARANVARATSSLQDENEQLRDRVAVLREALIGLLPWVPSSTTYRGLGFDPEAPEQALRRARAALEYGCDDD